jgi:AraC-like DNA-binding protein
VPADDLVDLRVPLSDVWSTADVGRAVDAVSTASIGAGLEEIVLARLAEHHPDPIAARVVAGLDAGRRVHEIARLVGLSDRQLHRRCLSAFGYGPKTLDRIRRMQRVLAAPASMPGARVAADAGYADQAHLAREVRALAGVPYSRLTRSGH